MEADGGGKQRFQLFSAGLCGAAFWNVTFAPLVSCYLTRSLWDCLMAAKQRP